MNTKQLVQNTLSQDAFLLVNKKILKNLDSANAAIIISSLISKFSYFESRGEIVDNYFFNTKEMLMDETGLSEKVILSAEKLLETKGYITTKLKGLPRKKYYSINWDFIHAIISDTQPTESIVHIVPSDIGNNNQPTIIIQEKPIIKSRPSQFNSDEQLDLDKWILTELLDKVKEYPKELKAEIATLEYLLIENEDKTILNDLNKREISAIKDRLTLLNWD